MSFADLFARYRIMGAMGPQPLDEHGFLLNEAGNAWTYTVDDDSQDAPLPDGYGVKQDRHTFKPSRPFVLTPEGDYVKVSSDEGFEELFSPSPRLGLNLGLLKNNNVCKDYYRLTSSVLKSLIMGIKEMATEEITPAWQVGFPCSSPKMSFSSLLMNKLNEDFNHPKLSSTHTAEEIGTSKLSPISHPSNPSVREVVNIADLRRWLWSHMQLEHPVSYLVSTSPTNEWNGTDKVIWNPGPPESKEEATSEAEFIDREARSRETPSLELKHVTSSNSDGQVLEEEDSMVESANFQPNMSESAETKTICQAPIDRSSSQSPMASTAEDDEGSTKHCTDSDSDHEPLLLRKPRPVNQTASGNKQCTSSRGREDMENPRRCNEVSWKSASSKSCNLLVGSRLGEVDRVVSSSRPRQQVVARNNQAIIPPRPKSWCLVGGYVKRFPTKHHTSRKIQPPKSQPQVPLAA